MEAKKLRLEWVNIGGTNTGSYSLNLQGAAGLYIGIIPGTNGQVTLDGAVYKSPFVNMEMTIQPQPGVEINTDIFLTWTGAAPAMIIACKMYYVN